MRKKLRKSLVKKKQNSFSKNSQITIVSEEKVGVRNAGPRPKKGFFDQMTRG